MTKFKKLTGALLICCAFSLTLLFYIGCSKKGDNSNGVQKTMSDSTAATINGTIGYLDSANNFVPVSDSALTAFFRKIFDIDSNVHFQKPYIIRQVDTADNNAIVYTAKCTSRDGVIKISSLLKQVQGAAMYALSGKSCKCTSNSCSGNWGCDALIFAGMCNCSPCDVGDCKKESSATSLSYLQTFFAF